MTKAIILNKQYAKIRIDYTDYLIDLSDVQALFNVMSRAIKLSNKYDSASDKYTTYRDGRAEMTASIAKIEEVNAPAYVKPEAE
jgi:hypothetical protein